MEILFDILEVVIIIVWVAFAIFGSKIFKRKNKQEQRHQYPQSPQQGEKAPQTAEEVSEEERKLKEWLENVFGSGQKQEEPVQDEYYEDEEVVLPPQPATNHYSIAEANRGEQLKVDLSFSAPEVKVETIKKANNAWQGRIGKSQMAYGLVMAEIFQKPRALRPFRRMQIGQK